MLAQRGCSVSDYESSCKKSKPRQRSYSGQESRRSQTTSHDSGYESMHTTGSRSTTRSSLKLDLPRKPKYQQVEHRSPPPKYEDIYPLFVELDISDDQISYPSDSGIEDPVVTQHRRHSSSAHRRYRHASSNDTHLSPTVEIPEAGEQFELRFSERSGSVPEIDYLSSHRTDDRNSTMRLCVGDETVDYQRFQPPSLCEAKDMLIQYAKNKPLCSHKQAKRCDVKYGRTWCAFRYTLKTLTEDRVVYKKTRPYVKGQRIDKDDGRRIDPYDIEISQPLDFCNDDAVAKIPHTEKKIRCKDCSGSGRSTCRTCDGIGTVPCIKCHASDGDRNYSCQCHGGGDRCGTCGGNRTVRCKTCQESGWVVAYKQLKITWSTVTSDHVDEHPDVPTKHLLNEKGRRVYSKKACKLEPLQETDILHKQIQRESKLHLEKHNSLGAVTLLQKHVVELVPVHAIDCQYKQKSFRFYMIGENCKIHAPDYPGKFLAKFSCFH